MLSWSCRASLLTPNLGEEARGELMKKMERDYTRLVTGAQPDLGRDWDEVLEEFTRKPALEKALKKEDLYVASTSGVKGEYLMQFTREVLLKDPDTVKLNGWSRTKAGYTSVARQVRLNRNNFGTPCVHEQTLNCLSNCMSISLNSINSAMGVDRLIEQIRQAREAF